MPAPKGNKYAKGNKGGRPTSYMSQYAKQAKELCERGATNSELARFFGVSVFTIRAWRMQYEEFATAVRVGKAIADQRVEEALFERAIGYDYDCDLGRGKSVIRHIPPDIGAIKVWLYNRRPDRWKEKVEFAGIGSMADRSRQEIKRALVQKMVEWGLVPIENVPPELLAPIDSTVDDD
jgi:hypothetical protein